MVEVIIVSGIVLVLVVVFTVAFFMDDQRRARRWLRRRPTPLAEARPGEAITAVGRVRSLAAAATTLGGDQCVHVHIAVLQFFRKSGSDGAISESWKMVAEEARGGPFEIADATGAATVDPAGAISVLDQQVTDVRWDQLSAAERELIERHADTVTTGSPARIRQVVIWPDQLIAVFGTLSDARAFAAGERAPLAIGRPR